MCNPALSQHLIEALAEPDITLVLGTFQKLFDLKRAWPSLLVEQLGSLGLLVSDVRSCRLSTATTTEGPSDGMSQGVTTAHSHTSCSGCHLGHQA